MDKLMKKDIQRKYDTFINNTCNINRNQLLMSLRTKFTEHFGKADDYLRMIEMGASVKQVHSPNYQDYNNQPLNTTYFKIENFSVGCIMFKQDHSKPKSRLLIVHWINWGTSIDNKFIMPRFIELFCNPEGIYILEKTWFDLII